MDLGTRSFPCRLLEASRTKGLLSLKLTKRFSQAFSYANELHQEQLRKGTQAPYLSHLMAVASLVLEHGGDEDMAIAALLHDAVEDQGGKPILEEIQRRFGARVAEMVDSCTDAYVLPKPPWKERKVTYIAHLGEATPEARVISNCDKLHNARSLLSDYRERGETLWELFRGGKDGTLWYYRSLVTKFRKHGSHPGLVEELDRVVTELEDLSR
jgi:(p)ppGpp synthase/HD superfamily hydrolase